MNARRESMNWLRVVGCALAVALARSPAQAEETGDPSPYIPVLSSYVQIRYTAPSEGDGTWAVRRLKAMIDGGPPRGVLYHVQFIYKTNLGSSTDDQVVMQDAYVILHPSGSTSIKAGQFVPPFGLERFQPDSRLDFVDRTDVTNRFVVNGNLGRSFARDRGVETDWRRQGWELSAGLFRGGGANMPGRGNGPLATLRASDRGAVTLGRHSLSWRAGLAAAERRAADLDVSAVLPELSPSLTRHFDGRDRRINAFAETAWGPVRAQGEYIRLSLLPSASAEIPASGAYGQIAYLPRPHIILAVRHERIAPDLHDSAASSLGRWTGAATYDFTRVPLRLAIDYSVTRRGTATSHTWRLQGQYVLIKGLRLGR